MIEFVLFEITPQNHPNGWYFEFELASSRSRRAVSVGREWTDRNGRGARGEWHGWYTPDIVLPLAEAAERLLASCWDEEEDRDPPTGADMIANLRNNGRVATSADDFPGLREHFPWLAAQCDQLVELDALVAADPVASGILAGTPGRDEWLVASDRIEDLGRPDLAAIVRTRWRTQAVVE